MPPPIQPDLPVWYLLVDVPDPQTGKIVPKAGSAVLVTLVQEGQAPILALVTAQHVLRSGGDMTSGPYGTNFRAWPPDVGFGDLTDIPLTLMKNLTPAGSGKFEQHLDFAFLALPPSAYGKSAHLANDAEIVRGLSPLTVSGYPGGPEYITSHAAKVHPSRHPEWTYSDDNPSLAISILSSGQSDPHPGVSGGGVFFEDKLVGIYRGTFSGTGEHIFLPLSRIRSWCYPQGFQLSSPTSQDQATEPPLPPPTIQSPPLSSKRKILWGTAVVAALAGLTWGIPQLLKPKDEQYTVKVAKLLPDDPPAYVYFPSIKVDVTNPDGLTRHLRTDGSSSFTFAIPEQNKNDYYEITFPDAAPNQPQRVKWNKSGHYLLLLP